MSIILCFCLLLLGGCGFSPVYGTHNSSTTELSNQLHQIDIALIPNREGQYLRNILIDNFYTDGTPNSTRYKLNISPIEEQVFDFDVTVFSEATRRQLRLDTNMSLIDKQTNKTVLTRSLRAISSHNVLESEFSTLVTEQSAREDALYSLAQKIERQIAIYFSRKQ